MLKIWSDRYPFFSEDKGDYIRPKFKMLIVTSNVAIEQIWKEEYEIETYLKPLLRRFNELYISDLSVSD